MLAFVDTPLVPDAAGVERIGQQAVEVSARCLRCLLLVMCTYPFSKKALTLHLARGEGRERYFDCNLMQRKVLASSHQHLMAEAPRWPGSDRVQNLHRGEDEFAGPQLPWLSARQYAIFFFADHRCASAYLGHSRFRSLTSN